MAPAGAQPLSPWISDLDEVGPALSQTLGLPGFSLDHTRYTPSHSYQQAAPFQGRIPVIIYSHGWRLFRNAAVHQMESLASHGYLAMRWTTPTGRWQRCSPTVRSLPWTRRLFPNMTRWAMNCSSRLR